MEIIVYTRAGCPLCDSGIALARDVFGDDAVRLVDVDLDLDLLNLYNERVPVIVAPGGTVIDEGIITESALTEYRSLST